MINSDKYCAKYCYTIRFNIYFFIFFIERVQHIFLLFNKLRQVVFHNQIQYIFFILLKQCSIFSFRLQVMQNIFYFIFLSEIRERKKIKLNLRNTKKLSIILTEFRFSCVQLAVHCYASKRNSMQIFLGLISSSLLCQHFQCAHHCRGPFFHFIFNTAHNKNQRSYQINIQFPGCFQHKGCLLH